MTPHRSRLSPFLLLPGLCTAALAAAPSPPSPYQRVDPRIGTAGDGQTVPAVGTPFAMTTWTPETRPTEDKCIAPYYFADTTLTGFRASHFMSGSCGYEYGSMTLMPSLGPVHGMPAARAAAFSHQDEVAAPAFYSVLLASGIRVEVTATTRSALFRIHFPAGSAPRLLLDGNALPRAGRMLLSAGKDAVSGSNDVTRHYAGSGKPAGFAGHFFLQLQRPAQDAGYWCGDTTSATPPAPGACPRQGVWLTPTLDHEGVALLKVGTSMTSDDEARKNLASEIPGWNFDEVRRSTERIWSDRLRRVEASGGSAAQQTTFYTALYHAALSPRIVSDADGTYNGFAQEGHLHTAPPGKDEYDDFSLWDTFRALHPLLTLLDPERDQDMIRSLIDKGEQAGFLPIFPIWNSFTTEMIGDHVGSLVVDAYNKGLRDFDVAAAYRLMVHNADVTPSPALYHDGQGRRGLPSYLRYGYIPLEDEVLDAFHHHEQVSRTLEYSYDDFLIANLAGHLGHTADAARFGKRGENWRNVLDPSTGFVRGRHADGTWATPFDPARPQPYITESTPWQYTFFVPQNIPSLITAVGGRDAFLHKLDGVFEQHRYDPGNEPGQQIAFLYDLVGAPEKTRERVALLRDLYNSTPAGLPGNEDAGQMSAWYIFASLGFYPVCPGLPEYALASPAFPTITLHLPGNRTLEIRNTSAPPEQPQRVLLNQHPLDNLRLQHSSLLRGGVLAWTPASPTHP